MAFRKYALIALVAGLVGAAVWLRVHDRASAPALDTTSASAPACTTTAASDSSGAGSAVESARAVAVATAIPVPRDYVVNPAVLPGEADAGPRRIVSLAPSITEIVCALGMRDRLAGRTRYCQWPLGVQDVPTVGVMAESNYGLVKSLDPDLVLATHNSGQTIADLRQLGLRCEALPHEGLPEVYAAIEKIGSLCGRPRTARALVEAIQRDLRRLTMQAASLDAKPRRAIVLFGELPMPPKAVFVAGPGLFLDELLTAAGHRNAAADLLKSSQGEIPLEVLRVLDPEVILEFREPADPQVMQDVYAAWSRVGDLQAIRGRRIRSVGGLQWLSAGPRVAIELHRFILVLSEFR